MNSIKSRNEIFLNISNFWFFSWCCQQSPALFLPLAKPTEICQTSSDHLKNSSVEEKPNKQDNAKSCNAMRCNAMQCNATFRHRVRFYQRQRVIPKLTNQNQGKQDDKPMRIETSHRAGKFPKLYSFAFTEKRKQRRQTFFILIPANTTRTLMSCIVIHFKTSLFKNDLNFVEWVPLALSGRLQSKQQSKMLFWDRRGSSILIQKVTREIELFADIPRTILLSKFALILMQGWRRFIYLRFLFLDKSQPLSKPSGNGSRKWRCLFS